MVTIQTLSGTLDEKQLKTLKGALDEIMISMRKMEHTRTEIKDTVDATHDILKIPKKIIKKLAKVQYKQTFDSEVAEQKEFEMIYEGVTKVN